MIKLIATAAFCFLSLSASAEPRQICLLLPLSGGQAAFGHSVMNGAILAKEESTGCVAGSPFCSLKDATFHFEDHGGEPSKAVSAAQRLLTSNSCSAFIVFGSTTSLAINDLLERAQKLTISIATSDKIQTGKRFIFRSMASAHSITAPLAAESERLGLKSIVSVTTIHDGMFAYRDAFEAKRGQPYLKKLEVNPGDTDLSSIALQAQTVRPDGVFITLLPPQAAIFARHIRKIGYRGQLFAANQIESPAELKAAGEAFDGLWYAREGSAASATFDSKLSKRFPEEETIFSANGYDAARLLTAALDTPDPRETLEKMNKYQGALGSVTTLDDHSFTSDVRLMVVKGGRFTDRN